MEMNHEYASKGVAGAGLGTGIAGLSLGVLNSLGGLGALAGTWGRPSAAQIPEGGFKLTVPSWGTSPFSPRTWSG